MRFLLAALVLVPALAHADAPAPAPARTAAPAPARSDAPAPARTADAQQMKTDDCARARKQNKTCVLDMGSETIEGGVKKPEGEVVDIAKFGKSASLIRIRRDFIVEILKSAEDL